MLQNQGRSPVGQGLAASHGSLRGASNIRRPLAPSRATPRPLPSGGAHPEQHDRAQHDAVTPAPQQLPQQQQQQPASDPEAKYQRFGPFFGGRFSLSDLVDAAPRVRVRTTASRARNELLELAVLNERLAGVVEPWEARARLEVLRNRRRAWDAVYDLVSGSDAAATLEVIEAAAEQADALLSEDGQERTSVSELRRQLITLQQQVEEAGEKLAATQSRVDQNLQRVERLKREAAALERARGAASAAHAQETPLAAPAPAPALAARAAPAPAPPSPPPGQGHHGAL
ncbi:chlorophyll a oxygenase [Monoraphidium neglectum]|uniref:Chlorophyll a oxygenase n=1 Tax=Monoraphidium neglectum TaxID=145388 RepID=A0A0D2M244_9CHLO|nr:chlorophyll a oxygenase [Monoraphidium neglectum]KIY95496.1 chlorophyll a oxygenase [Monoraphidium neglectum]|eukprot:XP_013894516.1 chlorophyll a oxygenase [Monoraphidium neglectum]